MPAEHPLAPRAVRRARRRHLPQRVAVALFAAGGLADVTAAFAAPAAVHVGNCSDAGPGSLRDAVALANSGDVIDLTGLACSTISLSTGEIAIAQASLTLIGPGSAALAIDGGGTQRVFAHNGAGALQIEGLTVRNGYVTSAAGGGCIRAAGGTLVLNDATVSACKLVAVTCSSAFGGAVYARGDAIVLHSTIDNGDAEGAACAIGNYAAQGGGLYVGGTLTLLDSTISGSKAGGTQIAIGGGIWLRGSGTFQNAHIEGNSARYGGGVVATAGAQFSGGTIDSNSAVVFGGGLSTSGPTTLDHVQVTRNNVDVRSNGLGGGVFAGAPLLVRDTQFAYNTGALGAAIYNPKDLTLERATIAYNYRGAAIYTGGAAGAATITNSTIAGNRPLEGGFVPSAVVVRGPAIITGSTIAFNTGSTAGGLLSIGPTLQLHSTILAGNRANGVENDLTTFGGTLTGEHNLVGAANSPTPPDTISACPKLDRLAMNGGATPTLQLLQGSAGIDAGSNVLALATDQRGTGFARSFGVAPDIGAFERQGEADDALFSSAFEAYCDGHLR